MFFYVFFTLVFQQPRELFFFVLVFIVPASLLVRPIVVSNYCFGCKNVAFRCAAPLRARCRENRVTDMFQKLIIVFFLKDEYWNNNCFSETSRMVIHFFFVRYPKRWTFIRKAWWFFSYDNFFVFREEYRNDVSFDDTSQIVIIFFCSFS